MKFEVRYYDAIGSLCLYTVHVDGEEDSETDIFFKRFATHKQLKNDVAEIKRLLVNMGRYGARPDRFRSEDNAEAIPKTRNNLRLYCIRISDTTVILAGGGQKTSQEVRDSPDCYPHFKFIKQVEKLFRERVVDRDIWYNGSFIEGKLSFDTEKFL